MEAIVGLGTLGAAGIAAAVWGPEEAKEVVKAAQDIYANGYSPLLKSALPFVAYLVTAFLGVWSIKKAIKGNDSYKVN